MDIKIFVIALITTLGKIIEFILIGAIITSYTVITGLAVNDPFYLTDSSSKGLLRQYKVDGHLGLSLVIAVYLRLI